MLRQAIADLGTGGAIMSRDLLDATVITAFIVAVYVWAIILGSPQCCF
jgi:hypothetical protein